MSISLVPKNTGAPADATYLTQTANANLTNEQALSSLATGYMKVTTGTGVVTSQAVPIPVSDGGTGATSFTTNGVIIGGATLSSTAAGASNRVLRGNAGSAPTFGQVVLTTDVTGVLPFANGGTNASTSFTDGSVIFSNGTSLAQDNANFFWDRVNARLYLGGTTAATADITLDASGASVFNEQGNDADFRVEGTTATNLLVVDASANSVEIGTTVQGRIAKFTSTAITFNDDAQNLDFRVEGQAQANLLFTDASADQIGIRTNAPHSTLDIRGGISLDSHTVASGGSETLNGDDFNVWSPVGAAATTTITLPAASVAGRIFFIKKTTATGTLRITPAGADTIDGVAGNLDLTALSSARTLISDGGTNWMVMATV